MLNVVQCFVKALLRKQFMKQAGIVGVGDALLHARVGFENVSVRAFDKFYSNTLPQNGQALFAAAHDSRHALVIIGYYVGASDTPEVSDSQVGMTPPAFGPA